MTTGTETTEAILRELAELNVWNDGSKAHEPRVALPDPRFEALRGEHEWDYEGYCKRCGEGKFGRDDVMPQPYCLRTDLGSILEAIRACNFSPVMLTGFAAILVQHLNGTSNQPLALTYAKALKDAVMPVTGSGTTLKLTDVRAAVERIEHDQ